jgi:hypothetical protein
MPPAAPSAYTMCPGWNMFGFTSLTAQDVGSAGPVGYLWNLVGTANQPLVYGWKNTGDWTTSGWEYHPFGNADLDMLSGQGFWGYFPAAGMIVP